jgi:hypothetical protein
MKRKTVKTKKTEKRSFLTVTQLTVGWRANVAVDSYLVSNWTVDSYPVGSWTVDS